MRIELNLLVKELSVFGFRHKVCRPQNILLLLLLSVVAWAACSEYDTNSVGQSFLPINSQVRSFTHLVYVEYTPYEARVWGPRADEVEATVNKLDVELTCQADSLVIVAYGFPSKEEEISTGSLTIRSDRNYALYLNSLTLDCRKGPAISSLGKGSCYLVLPQKSVNKLASWGLDVSERGDGCIYADGQIVLGGVGKLSVINHTESIPGHPTHAISAAGFQCQYNVNVQLQSLAGDGIHVLNSMRSSDGTWDIVAGQNGIFAGDSIVLFNGTYTGTATEGAFLWNRLGAAMRMPKITAASAWASDVLDSLSCTQLFDSVQAVWQEKFDDFVLLADSSYKLVDTLNVVAGTLKCTQEIADPYVLITNATIKSDAELSIQLSSSKK